MRGVEGNAGDGGAVPNVSESLTFFLTTSKVPHHDKSVL